MKSLDVFLSNEKMISLPLLSSDIEIYKEAIKYFCESGESDVYDLLVAKFTRLLKAEVDKESIENSFDDDDLEESVQYIDLENAANVAYRLGYDVPEKDEDALEKEIAKVCESHARYYAGLEDVEDRLYIMGNESVENAVRSYCIFREFARF